MRLPLGLTCTFIALAPAISSGQSDTARLRARNAYLPVIGAAPETGVQFGGTWLRLFRRGADSATRTSQAQVYAIQTAKGQRRAFAMVDAWSEGNKRRRRARLELIDFPLPLFAVGQDSPDDLDATYVARGFDLQYLDQKGLSARGDGPWYRTILLGIDAVRATAPAFTRWNDSVARPEFSTRNQARFGPGLLYDSRDHALGPRKGTLAQGSVVMSIPGSALMALPSSILAAGAGSLRSTLDFRRYTPAPGAGVLAVQTSIDIANSSSASFDDLASIGSDTLMRGYVRSRFRDSSATAIQAEYRSGYVRRFGVAVFAGVATLGPSLGRLGTHGLIASGGAGLRFQLAPAQRSVIRIDYARGRRGGGLYVALGEAF